MIEIFETEADRIKEAQLILRASKYLTGLRKRDHEYRFVQTPTKWLFDFEMHIDGHFYAIGEIKSRVGKYTTKYMEEWDWAFPKKRMEDLNKFVDDNKLRACIYVLHTADDDMFVVSCEKLRKIKLNPAPKGCMTNDHGTKSSDEEGVLIPFNLLTKVE